MPHAHRFFCQLIAVAIAVILVAFLGRLPASETSTPVPIQVLHPDRPIEITFPAEPVRHVRLLIHAANQSQPCVDELEIYGPNADANLAISTGGAKPTASSCISGYAKHAVRHLNDGRYGNDFSWIAAGQQEEWAEIELPETATVSKVVFSRDRSGKFADRMPIDVEVLISASGTDWKSVARLTGLSVAQPAVPGVVAIAQIPNPPPPPSWLQPAATPASAAALSHRARQHDEAGIQNLAPLPTTIPAASSTISGFPIHQLAHLNDGLTGNDHSWIAAANPAWAELDLGDEYWIYHVTVDNDGSGKYRDRAATRFSILTATEYASESEAPTWQRVYETTDPSPLTARRSCKFSPVKARWVRIAISDAVGGAVRLDEIEVFGSKQPIAPTAITLPTQAELAHTKQAATQESYAALQQYAIESEEHAWLKTYGHADLSDRLVPYNGRVQEYPRHAPSDRLPLSTLATAPTLDGTFDDACWQTASRGVARVAHLDDAGTGPLVETAVRAGVNGQQLYLQITTDRLLSSHLAVISRGDGQHAGVVVITDKGLQWTEYGAKGDVVETVPLKWVYDTNTRCFEFAIALDTFPQFEQYGVRVGLGMGGKHTQAIGQAIDFAVAAWSISERELTDDGKTFQVCLTAAVDTQPIRLSGNVAPLSEGITLQPGTTQLIRVPAEGPIGPESQLIIDDSVGNSYRLRLLRYDPTGRVLDLFAAMIERYAKEGIDVAQERIQLADLRRHQIELFAGPRQVTQQRQLLLAAHEAKRQLFFRHSDLQALEQVLFVKRHAFEPSHNYSVLLDSPYRAGGGIFVLTIPHDGERLSPAEATLTELFNAGGGIARNPMANFDLSKIYFAYRDSAAGEFHIMEINSDGTQLKQLTDGPFHDYWPCPLPDGSLAFISTRCRARFLCWRPQAAVLFRMDADGQNMRPLSFANLTEWGPSVMSDGRIIWQRSEYVDKGADFSHTLWAIRPDGTHPELIFGNDIIQPNGYANGREVPGTTEFLCTLVSHFGDLNGPLALVDPALGRSNPEAITSLTPEVPWPGMWPREECFRDGFPISQDFFLCSHAPRDQFGLYVVDRYGNRELLYLDASIGSMCPTLFRQQPTPPIIPSDLNLTSAEGEFFAANVYAGLEGFVEPGTVKYLRVCQEVRADLEQFADGTYRADHVEFEDWYASPTHKVQGPFGWPSFVAKASLGLVPVEADGSVRFKAPAGRVLYFEVLDEQLNEIQRMRSVVQLQPGERRSCVGCHEPRRNTPRVELTLASKQPAQTLEAPSWGAVAFSYEAVVQPVWNKHCVSCHDASDTRGLNLAGKQDADKVPASYRTLVSQGWVHYLDYGWNSGGNEKRDPLTFGTKLSRLWDVLDQGHYDVQLSRDDKHRIKCWTDLNCPLWPDYQFRGNR